MRIANMLFMILIVSVFFIGYGLSIQRFGKKEQQGVKHNFFIQVPLDSAVILEMQERLQPKLEAIVRDVCGIEWDPNFPIVYFKKRQAITLYYVYDLVDCGDPIQGLTYLFLQPVMKQICATQKPEHVFLTANLTYFGEPKRGLFSTSELVMLIDDAHQELHALHTQAKEGMRYAFSEFTRAYDTGFYDMQKSEQYAYVPHLSLGHLRENYIRFLIDDNECSRVAIQEIKERFKQLVIEALDEIAQKDRKIAIDKVALYRVEKREFVEECTLQ